MSIYNEIMTARKRLGFDVLHTPLLYSPYLSSQSGGQVYLKMESEQYTGSFKARGSLNKLRWLQENKPGCFPITASTGNHGLGFARALDLLDLQGRIYLPENTVASKVERIRQYNVELAFYADDPYETEMYAKQLAEKHDSWVYVSPYNDPQVIGGQGTIGIEILEEMEAPDKILATVGGGGLISGIASYFQQHSPATTVVGCQPANSPEMTLSVRKNTYQQVDFKPTLSDGSAGGFERDSITFDLCRKLVNRFILVSENKIEEAVRLMIDHHSKLVEGAAAVAVASFLKGIEQFEDQTTVIIICGANISRKHLREIL